MGNSWSTDIRHFEGVLDPGARAPRQAQNIARYFGSIVEAASSQIPDEPIVSRIRCRRRPKRKPCPGCIGVVHDSETAVIHWSCTSCGDHGVIHGWSGTCWDRRSAAQPTERPVEPDSEVPEPPRADPARKTGNVVPFPRPSTVAIEQILREFLEHSAKLVKKQTLRKDEDVLELLQSYLDSYGHQSLDEAERALFEQHFNAEGPRHKTFCQLFGPEKIPENLGEFLGYFMIRKVIAPPALMRASGTVTKKLVHWLRERGLIDQAAAKLAEERSTDAARDLPRAEEASGLIADHVAAAGVDVPALDDDDYFEFSRFEVVKVEAGRLWLRSWDDPEELGPLPIPKTASRLLQAGWEISCGLGRVRGRWRIVEMGNVYPA